MSSPHLSLASPLNLTDLSFSGYAGNHSASERPWLKEFAPRLERSMNTLKGSDEYEVIVSKADREPLEFA